MIFSALLALTASLVPSALAVFADDAYHVDYHHALLGTPLEHATFFHQPNVVESKASLLYTLSEQSVLGAVHPKDGSIVWRQRLSDNASTDQYLRAGEGQDTVISGVAGSVAAWSAIDGRLVWNKQFDGAWVKDLEVIEFDDGKTAAGAKDAVALFQGGTPAVRRLDGQTGAVKWVFEDSSGDAPFQVSTSATAIYLISLHSTMLGSLKLKVVSLDPLSGQKVDQYTLSSESELSSADDILFVGANSASPLLAWTDKSHKTLKVNIIGTKNTASFSTETNAGEEIERVVLHAPHHINSVPHFLVHYQTATAHWAEVYHVDLTAGSVSKAYSLPKLSGKGTFSTSTTDANVYFTRVTEDEVVIVSSASHGVIGRWPTKGPRTSTSGKSFQPIHAVSEVAVKAGTASAVRTAVLSLSGDWFMLRNGETSWIRPEALADAIAAVWADFKAEGSLAQELEIETHQNALEAYMHRLKRHIKDLQHLPEAVQALPKRFLSVFSGEESTSAQLQRDSFGFHKLAVVSTKSGRVIALDAGSAGKVVWNENIFDHVPDANIEGLEMVITPQGQIGLIGKNFLMTLDSSTGNPVSLSPMEPSAKDALSQPAARPGSISVEYKLVNGELQGFTAGSDPLWRFSPGADEEIVSITARPLHDPVASIGKVLGDRSVLYKYLNPNLVFVTAIAKPAGVLSVYLLDSVSGNVVYEATHAGVDITQPIPSALSENWVTYSFSLSSTPENPSRGHQLVVAEFFESTLPNDRGPFGAAANYSSLQPSDALGEAARPHVLSQTYHIPEPISHMTITQTAQGITSKQLLATLAESNAIVGIPRPVIDPRRPVGRDPTTDEQSEGLMKYAPVIEFDPRMYLNHKRELLGIKNVLTSPALLESTSLVFAYGLDVFGSRVSPSFAFDVLGKDFNKFQLVTTVGALAVAVLFVAPLVRRKQINARWQIP
ncbi:DUF1620-domain-containing protein [Saccharata proteae CBS 121410]|uniref:ER membrane protein complex subunit 1 n=1 Tax=Saccharata proteae CBS 121410 TaxID=1314787 RepID=A0A9P4HQW3_9PEZI|nr:DUF1620-domain-containing protein [Saccharata proteae CBS 121410]